VSRAPVSHTTPFGVGDLELVSLQRSLIRHEFIGRCADDERRGILEPVDAGVPPHHALGRSTGASVCAGREGHGDGILVCARRRRGLRPRADDVRCLWCIGHRSSIHLTKNLIDEHLIIPRQPCADDADRRPRRPRPPSAEGLSVRIARSRVRSFIVARISGSLAVSTSRAFPMRCHRRRNKNDHTDVSNERKCKNVHPCCAGDVP